MTRSYRCRLSLIKSILSTLINYGRSGKSTLQRKSNTCNSSDVIPKLVKKGLIIEEKIEHRTFYSIHKDGYDFLNEIEKMESLK